MNLNLRNKVVLVTGSSRGLGRVIAAEYLAEGARVCLVARGRRDLDRTCQALREEFGAETVHAVTADVSREPGVRACLRAVRQKYGRLDILVANAGTGRGRSGGDLSEKDWQDSLNVNLIGPALLIREARPLLQKTRGTVVLVSSIAGREATPAPVPYSVAKMGLMVITRKYSRWLAPDRIRINAVCPGNILLPSGVWERKLKEDRKAVEQYIAAEVPMKRFASGEEVAGAVLFLSSDRASFITGATLVVDGGQTRGWL